MVSKKHLFARLFGHRSVAKSTTTGTNASNGNINCVDGVPKPTQRQINVLKDSNTRFGADLVQVENRIFVLGVDESEDASGDLYPAMRAGLSRFDEVTQVQEDDVECQPLADLYAQLFMSKSVQLTVVDRPVVRTSTVSGQAKIESALAQLETGAYDTLVYTHAEGCGIPAGHAIVEVENELVLGMTFEEFCAVVQYTAHKKQCDVVNFTTMPLEYAGAFLAAYQKTHTAAAKDWKNNQLLRRSLRHSSRKQRRPSLRGTKPNNGPNSNTFGGASAASTGPGFLPAHAY